MKKNEDHCGCKTVYTPQGLKGDQGDPGTSLDTHVIQGHTIVLADISQTAPDLTIDVFNSGTFNYKILENRMVWFSLLLSLDITMAAGINQAFLNMRVENLPVVFGDPTGGGFAGFIGEIILSNPTFVTEANLVKCNTVLGSDSLDLVRLTSQIAAGSHTMSVDITGNVPGLII